MPVPWPWGIRRRNLHPGPSPRHSVILSPLCHAAVLSTLGATRMLQHRCTRAEGTQTRTPPVQCLCTRRALPIRWAGVRQTGLPDSPQAILLGGVCLFCWREFTVAGATDLLCRWNKSFGPGDVGGWGSWRGPGSALDPFAHAYDPPLRGGMPLRYGPDVERSWVTCVRAARAYFSGGVSACSRFVVFMCFRGLFP